MGSIRDQFAKALTADLTDWRVTTHAAAKEDAPRVAYLFVEGDEPLEETRTLDEGAYLSEQRLVLELASRNPLQTSEALAQSRTTFGGLCRGTRTDGTAFPEDVKGGREAGFSTSEDRDAVEEVHAATASFVVTHQLTG